MKKQFKVPFDKNGNQITQNYRWDKPKLVDNYEFEDSLTYVGYEGAASTLIIVWKDANGKEYRSSMALLHEVLNGLDLVSVYCGSKFSIKGKFTFVKRGSAIFLTLVK